MAQRIAPSAAVLKSGTLLCALAKQLGPARRSVSTLSGCSADAVGTPDGRAKGGDRMLNGCRPDVGRTLIGRSSESDAVER
jgi:hypothetical protein